MKLDILVTDEMNLHVPQSIEAEIELMTISRCAMHIVSAQRNGPVNGIVQDGLVASFMLTMTWSDETVTMVSRETANMIYSDAEIPQSRVDDLLFRGRKYYPEYIIPAEPIIKNNEWKQRVVPDENDGKQHLFPSSRGKTTLSYSYDYSNESRSVNDFSTSNISNAFMLNNDDPTEESAGLSQPVFERLKFADEIPGSLFMSILFPPNFCYTRYIDPAAVESKPSVEIEEGIILRNSGPLCVKTVGGKNGSIVHDLWEQSPELALYFLSELQQITDRWLPTHGFSIGIRDCFASSGQEVMKVLLETRAHVDDIINSADDSSRLEIEINNELNNAMAVGPKLAKGSMEKGDRNALNIMRNAGAKGSVINLAGIVAFVGQQNIRGQRMPKHLTHGTRCLPSFLPGDNSLDARGFIENNYLKGLTSQESFFHAAAGRDGVISTSTRTADTGYTQKRMARKIEDNKVWIDGTVRDANGKIISFMYGDDGIDPKKLVSVKGLNTPFFINPLSLARQLNCDAKRSYYLDTGLDLSKEESPRKLTETEIEMLNEFIIYSKLDSPVVKLTTANARKTLGDMLSHIEIYECKIPDLFASIRNTYNSAKEPYGTMIGLIATSSLGEPTMQMTLSFFHNAGCKGKDISLGIPRFKELINTTKSKDQKKAGCTIYFDIPLIKENAKKITDLEKLQKDNSNSINLGISKEDSSGGTSNGFRETISEEITQLKKSSYVTLQNLKNDFEETHISDYLIDTDLKYLNPDKISNTQDLSTPTGLLTYEEYEEEWWVSLSKKMREGYGEIEPQSWVILLKFDVEKLYRRRIDLEDIVVEIEEQMPGFVCIATPNVIGRIEVYANLEELREHAFSKMSDMMEEENLENKRNLITKTNIDYYICRDVIIDQLKKVKITGIDGIKGVYPREDTTTHEYVMDTNGTNFINILTMPGVDPTRTLCDDMHSVYAVLGIEATRKMVFNELTRVISFDGTYVNPRHIVTLVDAMMVNGTLTAASRDGISRDVGPNAKIMFEKNIDNAVTASTFTERDDMVSLASSVMYGKLAISGAGMVTVRNKERIGNY